MSEVHYPKPPYPVLLMRAWTLRCPRCGRDRMFAGLFRMNRECAACGLRYEREQGYFLGSIYLNYGATALLTTAGYITLRLGFDVDARVLLAVFAVFCVVFPALYFRFARALWLAMDCQFDPTAMIGNGITHDQDSDAP